MTASDKTSMRMLPLMIGRKLSRPLHEHRVGVRPGDELARRHAVEVGEVERLQVLLHGIAQVVLNVEGDTAAPVSAEVGTDEGHDSEAKQRHQPRRERRGVPQDHVVDDLALDQGHDHLGEAADDGTSEGDEEVALVHKHVAAEAPHPTWSDLLLRPLQDAARFAGASGFVCLTCAVPRPPGRSPIPSATKAPITSSRRPVRPRGPRGRMSSPAARPPKARHRPR